MTLAGQELYVSVTRLTREFGAGPSIDFILTPRVGDQRTISGPAQLAIDLAPDRSTGTLRFDGFRQPLAAGSVSWECDPAVLDPAAVPPAGG
jgi:hypothetical protein